MTPKLDIFSRIKNGINNMMIPTHYVPILKWKRAEQNSIKNLYDSQKDHLTPLIELVMPKAKPFKDKAKKIKKKDDEILIELISEFENERIPQIPEEIRKAWGQRPIYVDFSLLYPLQLRTESITGIFTLGSALGLNLIPVLNLNDDEVIKKTISSISKIICLRLVSSDLSSIGLLNKKISVFLNLYDLSETNIDLLIDLKEINEEGGSYQRFMSASQSIEKLLDWRNLIFASGAFPEDMTKCTIDDMNKLPRFDWINWYNNVSSGRLLRNPIFSDYTIRHPIYRESLQFFAPTTTIKYTSEKEWFVMKGKKQKFELYLANAYLLLADTSIFYGESFSYGDQYIAEKGKHYPLYMKDPKIGGTGSTETWIMAGINHHLACTIDQIGKLS